VTEGAADDDTTLARIRVLCSEFPEAAEARLQGRPLFHVRRRRFAIFNGDTSPVHRRWQAFGRSLHVVADAAQHLRLQGDSRFRPSPHHGFRGWLAVDVTPTAIAWVELAVLLEHAYRAVAGRELVAELERQRQSST
jgi:hypothetical protein